MRLWSDRADAKTDLRIHVHTVTLLFLVSCFIFYMLLLVNTYLLPKYLQQWGCVTISHNISFDPSPVYIYTHNSL